MSDFLEQIKAFEGRVIGPPSVALDAVNEAMIRHWCDAIGDTNPIYVDADAARANGHPGIVAPPTMLQAWSMRGLGGRTGTTAQDDLFRLLESEGFTSVVATNCDQEYGRYLVPGDVITSTVTIESVSDEKSTALGVGHFVTTRQEFRDADGDLVGTMRFRMLKFAPRPKPETKPKRPRPGITKDNEFWFEGTKNGELLIQRCANCHTLRHPPGPMCAECHSLDWDTIEASGRGTVYSYVVNHYPKVPTFNYPLLVAVIELEEGTRLVSNLVDVDPADVTIGMPVVCELVVMDDDLTLPQFRPAGAS
ncbi:MAG: 3-oxo-4,17-pregnadiene-20-carboxyl-CoA hydratase alpha subunit [Actinomycetota bacterium]